MYRVVSGCVCGVGGEVVIAGTCEKVDCVCWSSYGVAGECVAVGAIVECNAVPAGSARGVGCEVVAGA